MPTKQVVDRQKSAEAVIAAGETHKERVVGRLKEALEPQLRRGEKLPDAALLVELVTRALGAASAAMVAADEAHQRELADDAGPRAARDQAAEALYRELVELREIATGLLGGAAAATLGLSGDTPRDPVALGRFAGEVIAALKGKSLPPSRVRGAAFAASEWVASLEKSRAALTDAVGAVAREGREAEGTLTRRDQAVAAYDERFGGAASFLGGLFKLAGEGELADRFRPSARRPGRDLAG
jgi:hypothetical protein